MVRLALVEIGCWAPPSLLATLGARRISACVLSGPPTLALSLSENSEAVLQSALDFLRTTDFADEYARGRRLERVELKANLVLHVQANEGEPFSVLGPGDFLFVRRLHAPVGSENATRIALQALAGRRHRAIATDADGGHVVVLVTHSGGPGVHRALQRIAVPGTVHVYAVIDAARVPEAVERRLHRLLEALKQGPLFLSEARELLGCDPRYTVRLALEQRLAEWRGTSTGRRLFILPGVAASGQSRA